MAGAKPGFRHFLASASCGVGAILNYSTDALVAYLAELKKQTDNLRVMLASIEAELSERRERTALTDTTHAWLLSLGRRLDEIEEDTPEGFEKRKQLVGLLVESNSLGKSQQEGRAEVRIT
jgi:hypothetical protein